MISHRAIRIIGAATILAVTAIAAQTLGVPVQLSSSGMAQQAVPEIPFESIPDPLKLPPDLYFGEATGVAVNSKGHVFVFSRGNTIGPAYAAAAAQLKGNIYVADRGNRRIQVFDGEGKFLRAITIDVPFDENARPAIGNKPDLKTYQQVQTFVPGAPWTVCITPPPNQVLFTSDAYPGRVYKLTLDGKVLGVLGKSGKQLKQFGWIHGIACPSENEIHVAELLNWRVQKLILHPEQQKAGR